MMTVILFTKPAGIDPHENCVNYICIQGHRNVFEHGEDRSFRNGPSSPFQPPCFPMQFNIMHLRYSTQNPKEIEYN